MIDINILELQEESKRLGLNSKKPKNDIFEGLPFGMDGYLKQNLMTYYNTVKKSNTSLNLLVCGQVGTGKSTMAGQISYALNREFKIDQYYFDPKDFKQYLTDKNLKSGVFDEAEEAFDSKENRKFFNIELARLLQRSRFYNKFNIIVIPDFFALSKPLAVYHTQAMIMCVFKPNHKENRLEQGEFYFYDYNRKGLLYHKGRPNYNYNAVRSVFWGSFSKWFPGSYDEYNKRKDDSMEKYRNDPSLNLSERVKEVLKLKKEGLSDREIGRRLGISPTTANNWVFKHGIS